MPPVGSQTEALGVAGPLAGVHNGTLIVAGGANFDTPFWESTKDWHNDIHVYDFGNGKWQVAGKLPVRIAYSAVVSTESGLIAMGGNNADVVFDSVFLLSWNKDAEQVDVELLPSLPIPITNSSAVIISNVIYIAGGMTSLDLSSAQANFWRLDLDQYGSATFGWEVLPSWSGPTRALNSIAAQHNGSTDCIYVMSGRREDAQGNWTVLKDVYEFNPDTYLNTVSQAWRRRADMPAARMGAGVITIGQSHLSIISGADGSLYQQANELKENHPGFPKSILNYNTITNTWFESGETPINQLTSHTFQVDDKYILVSGEVKPRIRSADIWSISTQKRDSNFGIANTLTLVFYLLLLVGIGLYFFFKNQTTDDFFRGGQTVPWWAAGCSIFATMLSSITFMAIPAKAYATDWVYILLNFSIIAIAPFIIYIVLPFFRKLNVTSAYEYLELRFNVVARLFASISYILFQLGRMAIVLYLPALALAAVCSLSVELCILLMGVLSILYCTLGGLKAVIWTDTIQTVVLLGGALLSFLLIVCNSDIGWTEFVTVARDNHKFRMIDWDSSYTGSALWIIILGGIGQSLIPYTSDQGVVQRYMSVENLAKASKSIWTNAVLSGIASILFFGLGTALFVFYTKHAETLDPTFQNDAIFPLFIIQELPAGVAGLVIAGIFAAAQSTISTSMNSISTSISVDFIKRFGWIRADQDLLRMARWLTVVFGLLGVGSALFIAAADVKSLWDSFIGILGLFGGSMCGLFLLGMCTTRANGVGAVVGAFAGAIVLWIVQQYTAVSFLLYASIGIGATYSLGYLCSLMFKVETKVDGLTIYSNEKK